MTVALQKAELRREMRRRLSALTAEGRAERSRSIIAKLTALPEWATAQRVSLFAPMPTEPDLDLLWSSGEIAAKYAAYPRVDGKQISLRAISNLSDLLSGPRSLREPPETSRKMPAAGMDLILVPGLAFTAAGARLGRGGGYYDRLLARAGRRPPVIGVAFCFQVIAALPSEPHDRAVDLLITDDAVTPSGCDR